MGHPGEGVGGRLAGTFAAVSYTHLDVYKRQALRCIGISFFALAAYVSVESMRALLVASEAEHSTLGIWIAALSLAVMPFLSWAQRRTGRELVLSLIHI